MDVYHASMSERMKRTYNLSPETLRRVRELSAEYGVAKSQDAVVELAVERLHAQIREMDEEKRWARAAEDPEFNAERAALVADLDRGEEWPR